MFTFTHLTRAREKSFVCSEKLYNDVCKQARTHNHTQTYHIVLLPLQSVFPLDFPTRVFLFIPLFFFFARRWRKCWRDHPQRPSGTRFEIFYSWSQFSRRCHDHWRPDTRSSRAFNFVSGVAWRVIWTEKSMSEYMLTSLMVQEQGYNEKEWSHAGWWLAPDWLRQMEWMMMMMFQDNIIQF